MESSKTEIVAYSKTENALAELRTKYSAVVFDVKSTNGMGAAKEARAELRSYRVDLEKVRVSEKAESLAYGRLVDSEAKRITAELEKLEEPIDDMIKAEEKRKADEKAEKERIEKERVDTIRARMGNIERWPLRCIGMSSEALSEQIIKNANEHITDELYMELKAEALRAWDESGAQLRAMLSATLDHESNVETQRLEAIRLDELRKAEELRIKAEREAEAIRLETERVAREDALIIERDKLRAERAELKAQQDRLYKERKAEEARLKILQDNIDKERKEYIAREVAATEAARIDREKMMILEEEKILKIRAEREAEEARVAAIRLEHDADAERLAIADQEAERIVEELGIEQTRPTNKEIIVVLADHFKVDEQLVISWLVNMSLEEESGLVI